MTRVTGFALLGERLMTAAKDVGQSGGDKRRKQALLAISKRATALLEQTPDSMADVREAGEAARAIRDTVDTIDQAAKALKDAPPGADDAARAQRALDRLRSGTDAMVPALEATLGSLELMLSGAVELEAQAEAERAELEATEAALKLQKTKLAAAAQAVKNATKIG